MAERLLALLILVSAGCTVPTDEPTDTAIAELSATELATRLADGSLTAERVTQVALDRIERLDAAGPALNSIIEVNPDALAIARSLDAAFAEAGPTGPLHGVPVALKANIDSADRMATSAGSLALAGHHPAQDAPLVAALRDAGAVIVAKTNLSEWANFRATASVSGWSSLGGQTHNPYVLDRNPCGSSSGSAVAVAARLVPLAVGTETDGSIVCPAALTGIVGVKPTLGAISQRGIIPIAASQDTAGPMARTVADAALLLAALTDEPFAYREIDSLEGWRVGVVRDFFGARRYAPVEAAFTRCLELLEQAGAELADPMKIGIDKEVADAELEVMLHEFKAGLNAYLEESNAPVASLEELIGYNDVHAESVMPLFGQDLFIEALARGDLDDPAYATALAAGRDRVRARLDEALAAVDVLVVPTNAPAWKTDWVHADRFLLGSSAFAAMSGYPSITVPATLISELPVGLSFVAGPNPEQRLIDIAALFEKRRGPFPGPRFIPSLEP